MAEIPPTEVTIALAGNPNAGKSTIFNALTGLRQHTGNWPGKTVAIKSGHCTFEGDSIQLVDLPGTYSLAAFSPDEIVARDFIIHEHPDAVICVVDTTNLERNLYMVVQVLEMGVPVILALNMYDQARSQGIKVDIERLSNLLGGVPVIPTAANRSAGLDQLLASSVEIAKSTADSNGQHCQCQLKAGFKVDYGDDIEAAIDDLSHTASSNQLPLNGFCTRWLALKLLEGEEEIVVSLDPSNGGSAVSAAAKEIAEELASKYNEDVEIMTADSRYGMVSTISRQVCTHSTPDKTTLTERVDRFATHRLLGLPIFLLVMYLVFRLVIDVSAPYLDWVDSVINGPVTAGLSAILIQLGASGWLHSLVIDGIIAGVGGILTFVPGLVVLFFFLAILEDSGYMARAAFVMDRFMRYIGLHGKSVIPLMLGFGCAVPAVYATRTISNHRDRLLTALLIPFMSCAARLPVYVVFALAFFGTRASTVIWLMYLLGIVVAILIGFIFSKTILKPDEKSAFVLELPPYRLPTSRVLAIHTWENTREFIKNAGTVILTISIFLWLLLHLPWGVTEQEDSLFGRFSAAIAPAFEPAGFGTYESSGALVTGLIAKEMVVSSLAQIYTGVDSEETISPEPNEATITSQLAAIVIGLGQATADAGRALISIVPGVNLTGVEGDVEDTVLSEALQEHYSPLSAIAFLIFVLLYVPCIATMGAIKQEFGGRWAASAAVYQTLVAWLAAVFVFQGGRMLGF